MSLDQITIAEAKQLVNLFTNSQPEKNTINCFMDEKVIIRTYSAGVWFGKLEQKAGDEVILSNARRMWRWWANKEISLSAVANYGTKHDKSKIACSVSRVWLQAIEILPCTMEAVNSIESAENAEAK